MDGEPVARRDGVDEPLPDQLRQRRPAAGVDHGRAGHGQDGAVGGVRLDDRPGDLADQRLRGAFTGDTTLHEPERAVGVARPFGRVDTHPRLPDDHQITRLDPRERLRGRPRAAGGVRLDHHRTVHLRARDREPLAVVAHLRVVVGRGVEPARNDLIGGRVFDGRVHRVRDSRAVLVEFVEDRPESVLVCGLDAHPAVAAFVLL